jgi:hypothetical protein
VLAWPDREAAKLEYEREATDLRPHWYAGRIRLRAERRLHELLARFDGRGRPKKDATDHKISRQDEAARLGLTPYQLAVGSRLAKIPQAEFDALVDRPGPPPTLKELIGEGETEPPRLVDECHRCLRRTRTDAQRFLQHVDQLRGDAAPALVLLLEQVSSLHGALRDALLEAGG